MKKILITFFVLTLSINTTFAGECLIKDKSSPALLEYIKNNRIVIREITNQILKSNKTEKTLSSNITDEFSRVKGDIVRIYNEAFDFTGYNSYFTYYAVFPISNEIPYEVKRDYKTLEYENNGLKSYLENIVKNNHGDLIIKGICKNINSKCDFGEEITTSSLIGKLIKNNNLVLDIFRNTVIAETNTDNYNLSLVGNNFELDIKTHYSISSYSECSKNEDGFFKQISDKIKSIGTLNKEGKDGIQKWKDAWTLLNGGDTQTTTYQEEEKRVLKKELSKQGVYGDSQTNMLNALDKYNTNGFSQNNNFIVNSFNNIKSKLSASFEEFKDDVIGDFFKEKDAEKINITQINKAQDNSIVTKQINERIQTLYNEEGLFEGISELNTNNLRSNIIDIHMEISDSINTLKSTCEKSVQVCNSQDSGKGNCGKCN